MADGLRWARARHGGALCGAGQRRGAVRFWGRRLAGGHDAWARHGGVKQGSVVESDWNEHGSMYCVGQERIVEERFAEQGCVLGGGLLKHDRMQERGTGASSTGQRHGVWLARARLDRQRWEWARHLGELSGAGQRHGVWLAGARLDRLRWEWARHGGEL